MRYPRAVASRLSLSIRLPLASALSRVGRGALALAAIAGWLAADQILQTYADSLTTYKAGKTKVQDARPRPEQRGVNLDGSLRRASTHPLSVAGNPFERVWSGEAELNGVRLDTGTYSPSDVDIALPASVPWVIGRSHNPRQDNAGQYDGDSYQGWNWFQSSQPEIVLYDDNDNTKDVLYLVYGADRYVEFNRTGSSATTYKSKNGASGVFEYISATTPDTWAYHAPDGIVATFLGFDTDSGNPGAWDGQPWKIVNANGDTAYVGSTTLSSVISAGYETDGRMKLAYDSAGRAFSYTYSSSTIGGKKRLESVLVTLSATEVARVEYSYYPDSPSPSEADPGDLRTVTTTLPLGDSVNDIRVQYYRYYDGAYNGSTNRGYPHQIKLVLDHEGTRKYDWVDTTFDSDFLTETTANLKEYATAYFEHDSSRRVDVAWFNGQCGCGSAGTGTHAISYGTNGSYSDNSGYDTAWCRRAVIDLPDTGWVTQYFDEVGQPLSRVFSDGDPSGSPNFWTTRVTRDATGCVTAIGTPASVTTYTHTGETAGSIANATTGLVRVYKRVSSGDLTGFLGDEMWRNGTAASPPPENTEYYLRSYVWWTNKATKTLGSVTLVRPLIKETWDYPVADTDDYSAAANKTAYDYTTYSASSQPLALDSATQTLPLVSTGNNGPNATHDLLTHYRLDGLVDFKSQDDGSQIITEYRSYTNGRVVEIRHDADTDGLGAPVEFEATVLDPINDDITTMSYDSQGRALLVTEPSGRVTKTLYSRLEDRRLVTIEFPRYKDLATDEYYGPASYTVANHAGKAESQGVIALDGGDSTAATSTFIDEGDDDPITAVDTDASAPYDFGQVAQLRTFEYDKSGTQLKKERAYFSIPSTLPGTDGTHYDETNHGHDDSGRRRRVKESHGTIWRTVYDARGQVIERWEGTNDYSFAGGESSGTDNMVKVQSATFDTNGYVTARTGFIQDNSTGQRVTSFTNDRFGRPQLTTNATAPHNFSKYDNIGRQIASGQFSSTGSIDVAADDPTTETSNRLALSQTFYDERGRVWKTQRHSIDAADGSNDDNLQTLTWYDQRSRVAKRDGETLEKFRYDRLNRQTHHFVLASVDGSEDTWAETQDVASDIVFEERQTTFDSDGKAIMQATISRFQSDVGGSQNTGALDTNADGGTPDSLAYTAADVKGRIQITAKWYDAWDRLEDVVQYGTNHATDNVATFDRDGLPVPTRSDTALRTTYEYNTDGTLKGVTDPRGLVTRYEYDAEGRRTKEIANYDGSGNPVGAPGVPDPDDNQTVSYSYTDGLQVSITADLPSGETDQVTNYTFGTTKGTSAGDSKFATGHLLKKVQYPDSSDATNDIVAYAYNTQGQEIWKRDQATTGNNSDYNIIETDYDDSGRQTARRVTQKRSAADGAVLRIATAFDSLGRVETVTQYDAATSGNVVDQVKNVYDGWGKLTNFRQDRDSTVGASGYWEVAYAYAKATDGRNTIRRTSITLPGSTTYDFDYRGGNSHDANASRLSAIKDAALTDMATYQYNGASQVVRTYLDEPDLFYRDYTTSATTFGNLDSFDRTEASTWTRDLATDRNIYRVVLAYDRNSNITKQNDTVLTGHDVKYANDNLNRLTDADEGTLSAGSITSRTRRQLWTLTQTGNWELDQVDLDGDLNFNEAGELNDDRTHNAVNELTARDTDDNGTDNFTFAYDAAGNMTDDGETYKFEWDPFGRLRKVKNQSNVLVSEYWYNGLGYLITRHQDTEPDGDVDGSDKKYYTAFDERWRPVATFRDSDTDPKEQFLYHAAGAGGFGGSSYIDLVVLRDRDMTNGWTGAADGALEERVYYCQNWRADVVALVTSSGAMKEWAKYSAYGVPFAMPGGDTDSDGDCDSTDVTQVQTWIDAPAYDVRGDIDLDGDVDATDKSTIQASYQGLSLGRGVLTASGVGNRKAYAGYELDTNIGQRYHVRYRTYSAIQGAWSQRDSLQYLDGANLYTYADNNCIANSDPMGLLQGPGTIPRPPVVGPPPTEVRGILPPNPPPLPSPQPGDSGFVPPPRYGPGGWTGPPGTEPLNPCHGKCTAKCTSWKAVLFMDSVVCLYNCDPPTNTCVPQPYCVCPFFNVTRQIPQNMFTGCPVVTEERWCLFVPVGQG